MFIFELISAAWREPRAFIRSLLEGDRPVSRAEARAAEYRSHVEAIRAENEESVPALPARDALPLGN